MPGEWREVAIEDIKAKSENALATGPFGSAIGSRFFVGSGIPVVRGSNLSEDVGTRLLDQGLVFLSADKAKEFRRSMVHDGDLIFTCWGTINQVGLVDRRAAYPEYIISNKQMKLTPDPSLVDSLFLYYLFSSPEMQDRLKTESIGSSVPGFNLGQLRTMRIRIPEIGEQRAISRVLGSLDDKIELNRSMNETLEAITRRFFKSWFVDFDVVRSKAQGREVGLPKALADLFPHDFEDSELGEIPKGWKVGPLEDHVSVIMGLSPDGESYNASGVGTPLINGPVEFGEHFPIKSKWTTAPTRMAEKGDLIFCVRGSTTGRRVVADDQYCMGRGVCALRAKDGTRTFLYQLINSELDRLLSKTTGSVFPSLNAPDIKGFQVIEPDHRLVQAFEKAVFPLTERIELNIRSSCTLEMLRDALLPKLISGELRIKDAGKVVGSTV